MTTDTEVRRPMRALHRVARQPASRTRRMPAGTALIGIVFPDVPAYRCSANGSGTPGEVATDPAGDGRAFAAAGMTAAAPRASAAITPASAPAGPQCPVAAPFAAAVAHALLHIAAPQELLRSTLLGCALLQQSVHPNPLQQVRGLLSDTLALLRADPRTAAHGRLLQCAYFDPPVARELLAARLHMGASTLRRRLKLARDALAATLWAAELAARAQPLNALCGEQMSSASRAL